MRKLTLFGIMLIIFLNSCATENNKPANNNIGSRSSDVARNMPAWAMDPPVSPNMFYGIGSAKMASQNSSKRAAEARARTDIAFQINTVVESMINDYAQESGAGDSSQVISFYESITRQIAQTNLVGSRTIKQQIMGDGTYWVMVQYSATEAKKVTSAAMNSAAKEDAAFAQWKAEQAMGRMDEKLTGNPPKSQNTQPGANPSQAPAYSADEN